MSKSDGSTADYYVLPEGATQLQDLISHRDMNSQIGEIFRACYRYGIVSHSDKMRDAKKIRFYAQAEIERLEKLASSDRCGQVEAHQEAASNLPCGYSWDDAPHGFDWFVTDAEGAFWFACPPAVKSCGEVWDWPGNGACIPIDSDKKKLAKYQRPTSTAK